VVARSVGEVRIADATFPLTRRRLSLMRRKKSTMPSIRQHGSSASKFIKVFGALVERGRIRQRNAPMRALTSSADAEAGSRPPLDRPKRLSHTPVVLLVEDDVLVRLAICDFLEADGFTVLEAPSGDDALRVLAADGWRIDVVFSDIRMPGAVDGLGLAKWMRENVPNMPIVLTSGNIFAEHAQGLPFISKPYKLETVAQRLRLISAH
jgi:CheY-like chemotaxis protein